MQRDDQSDPARQEQGQEPHRAGKAEQRWRELHVEDVEVEPANGPGRAQDTEAVPAVRDPDRSIVYASPRMGSEQDRFQVWRLETACKAEGVVRHAVTYSIEVAADQPNPLRHIE